MLLAGRLVVGSKFEISESRCPTAVLANFSDLSDLDPVVPDQTEQEKTLFSQLVGKSAVRFPLTAQNASSQHFAQNPLSPQNVTPKLAVPSSGSILFSDRLRGTQVNVKEVRQQDKRTLAGLRCAAEAVGRLPGHLEQ